MKFITEYSDFSRKISQKTIDFSVSGASYPYLLHSGDLYNYKTLNRLSLNSVKLIATNNKVSFAVTTFGEVFGWGEDNEGILCLNSCSVSSPALIKEVSDIVSLALSNDHVAAVNSIGELFTWGSQDSKKLGDNEFKKNNPAKVKSAQQYEAVSVVCGDNFTGFLTSGGYLLIYGTISSDHSALKNSKKREVSPYSNQKIDSFTISKIDSGLDFIAVLLDNNDIVVFDGCFNLTKLAVDEDFEFILANGSFLVGVGPGEITCWTRKEVVGKFECPVRTWKAEKFEYFNDVSIWKWENGFLVSGDEDPLQKINWENTITAEKNSDPAAKPCQITRMNSLLRLFPGDGGGKIIDKIMKVQEEFSNKTLLKDAFRKFLYPIVKGVFFIIKEYAKKRKVLGAAKAGARFFCICEKIYYSKFLNRFFQWKRKLKIEKIEKNLVKKYENFLNKKRSKKNKRKAENFLKQIFSVLNKSIRRSKQNSLSCFCELYNKTKGLKFIFSIFQRELLTGGLNKWKKELMSKILFTKTLEEKKLFNVTDWIRKIFFLLIQECQKKEIFLSRALKGCEKINNFYRFFQENSGMSKFKEMLIASKSNKITKGMVLKKLCSVLFIVFSVNLKKKCEKVFSLLKTNKKIIRKQPSQKKIVISNNRVKKTVPSYKLRLNLLKKSYKRSLKNYFDSILAMSEDKFRSHFYKLLFFLNSFITKQQFNDKLSSILIIKLNSGLLQSVNELDNSDENLQNLEEATELKLTNGSIQCSISESPLLKTENSVSPLRFCSKPIRPTSFRRGELVSYQKYLINKKSLEMIKEKTLQKKSKNTRLKTKKTKSEKTIKITKPPWKPSSISSNFLYNPKRESAIKKGINYYEVRFNKTTKRASLINFKKFDEFAMKAFMKRQSKSIKSDLQHRPSWSPFIFNVEQGKASLETLMNIGLGFVVFTSLFKKSNKKKLEETWLVIKKFYIAENSALSWRSRLTKIGLEKLKVFLCKKIRKIFRIVKVANP